jgi:hypothetical protein
MIDDLLFLFEFLFWWPLTLLCGAMVAAAVFDGLLHLTTVLRGGGHREGPV